MATIPRRTSAHQLRARTEYMSLIRSKSTAYGRATRRASSDPGCNDIGSAFQEGPEGREGGAYARMAEPVPCAVGVQVPRRDHTEVPPQSLLRKAPASDRPDPSGIVPATWDRTAGRARDARPHPPVLEHPAQVQRGQHDRVLEGQECRSDPSRVVEGTPDDGPAFLGDGILREHGGPRRGSGAAVHPRAG